MQTSIRKAGSHCLEYSGMRGSMHQAVQVRQEAQQSAISGRVKVRLAKGNGKGNAMGNGKGNAYGSGISLPTRLEERRGEYTRGLTFSENVENLCGSCSHLNRGADLKPLQMSAICEVKETEGKPYCYSRVTDEACPKYSGTLSYYLRPLMEVPSIRMDRCAICGRARPLEQHHIVRRSEGELYRDGEKLEKPTITLCGFGNELYDLDGKMYCHGMAHHHLLHFKAVGGLLFYLITERPMKELESYELDGWQVV